MEAKYKIITAEAGTGKTTTLTKEFILLLSNYYKNLGNTLTQEILPKILVLTFSNNATYEIKDRILKTLKNLYFEKRDSVENSIIFDLKFSFQEIKALAKTLLDQIINNYIFFPIKTIDSFTTLIFRFLALELNFLPDFEILIKNQAYLKKAFEIYLKDVKEGEEKNQFLLKIIAIVEESLDKNKKFPWKPDEDLLKEIVKIYEIYAQNPKPLVNSSKILPYLQAKKSIEKHLSNLNKNKELEKDYIYYKSFSFYYPYLKVFEDFLDILEKVKQKDRKIFIEDINKKLVSHLSEANIPTIYLYLGEKIKHFFIDEFQDTSPIQWQILYPLIENALSERGSLLIVGDPKQAIYTFRGADYKIMRQLERENPFKSAQKELKNLKENYRSKKVILDFVKEFFERAKLNDSYIESLKLTGLDNLKPISFQEGGYVEIKLLEYEGNKESNIENINEFIKTSLKEILEDLLNRGYSLKDIAILARKNDHIVQISEILYSLGYNKFVSYSNLDIRPRKVTDELLSLLKFLDNPLDNLAFGSFLLSNIFKSKTLSILKISKETLNSQIHKFLLKNRNNSSPLYKSFQEEFPNLWKELLEEIFQKVGYLPVYDLIGEIYNIFDVFQNISEEEAVFIKILDLIQKLENNGLLNLKEVINFFEQREEGDDKLWNLNIGADFEAIKLMTIHQAKGLGFPIVILYLEESSPRDDKIKYWEKEGVIYLIKSSKNNNIKEIVDLENNKRKENLAEEFNNLYVAFTRAKEELYILGIQKKLKISKSNQKSSPKPKLSLNLFKAFRSLGEKRPKESKEDKIPWVKNILNFSGSFRPIEHPFKKEIYSQDIIKGILIHQILAKIQHYSKEIEPNLEKLIIENCRAYNLSPQELKQIKEELKEMFKKEEILFLFSPEKDVRTEIEIVDKKGCLHRLDRLVIDKDEITIGEFKTGIPKEEDIKQLQEYIEIVSEIYKDKSVKGFLYYSDLKELEWLN